MSTHIHSCYVTPRLYFLTADFTRGQLVSQLLFCFHPQVYSFHNYLALTRRSAITYAMTPFEQCQCGIKLRWRPALHSISERRAFRYRYLNRNCALFVIPSWRHIIETVPLCLSSLVFVITDLKDGYLRTSLHSWH